MTFASFASFALLSLRNALGVPSTKFPIDNIIFVSYVLPPLVCYFVVALLAVTPQTRTLRVAVWPFVALLSLRAALSVDMSRDKPGQKFLNMDLVLFMLTIATRTLGWTLPKEPLLRHLRPANSAPSTILDAFDLVSNVRGHGWDWSGGLYVPRQTRPANRAAFVFSTLLSAIANTLICGALQRAILTLAPVGGGPIPDGSTIFDETLPFLVQYLRATIISVLAGFAICAVVQMNYDLGTMVAVLVLGQDPAQWPPILDAPWRATSVGDFWGRRWHQMLRQTFLLLGGYPLSFLLGRAGIVIGAFLASGVVHHILMVALGNPTESWRMLVGFGMMAPGVLAERAFQQWTGRRVGGVVGWVWTMGWVLLWGNLIIEELARVGMYGSTGFVDSVLPVRIPVERLVIAFDGWLHTM